ncbi:MAG: type IV secretion system protein [Cetobacterium sp.]
MILILDFLVIINEFKNLGISIITNLTPTVKSMLYIFLMLDLTLSMLFNEDDGLNIFLTLVKKILLYGFFIWVINEYTYIVKTVIDGFVQLGNLASLGVASKSLESSPGMVFSLVMSKITPIFLSVSAGALAMDLALIESLPITLFLLGSSLGIVAGLIALEIIIVFIKFYLTTALAFVLMPFGVFSKTRDIATKGLHSLLSQGIEIMVAVIIVNFFNKYIENFLILESIDGKSPIGIINNLVVVIFFFLLITRIPIIVSTLLTGSITNLSLTDSGIRNASSNLTRENVGKAGSEIKGMAGKVYSAYKKASGG